MTASKKGISAHQIHRLLGVSYKSTWFMMHRLREAMRTGGLEPLGGTGKIVEADETYFGKLDDSATYPHNARAARTQKRARACSYNRAILSLVERGGSVRTFHVPVADASGRGEDRARERRPRDAPAYRRKQPLQQESDEAFREP